jgi:hypothetical protein
MRFQVETAEHLELVVDDIVAVNFFLHDFWGNGGWATGDAARLLHESRLDRQVELSRTLKIWLEASYAGMREGRLILAWVNLGALVEGTMKWFLCVFAHDYAKNPQTDRNGTPIEPDDVWFAKLCGYFSQEVWADPQKQKFNAWCHTIRKRRNAIHAYTDNDVGNWNEWRQAVVTYREFLVDLGFQVPYLDEQFVMPYSIRQVIERVTAHSQQSISGEEY